MNRIYSLLFALLFSVTLYGQPGKDGAVTVTAANTVVNCYRPVSANVTAGSTTVTLDAAQTGSGCTLACGDLVMIYQAQGASMDITNTATYGSITAYNNAGLYEFNYIMQVAGNTVTVKNPWVNSYTATGKVQLIKVPQYTNLTVNALASIVPAPWQDAGTFRYGGIVAIHATGNVVVNGTIHATGFGFRPGPLDNNTSASGAGQVSLFVSTSSNDGAAKGESIVGFTDFYDANGGRYGRGAPANGGGGGNGHNCGGGGGSNGNNGNAYNGNGVMCTGCVGPGAWALDPFTISNGGVNANSSGGGRGGYSYGGSNQNALTLGPAQAAWGGDQRDPFGGLGGRPLTTIAAASRIFFGGGGGAGDRNNNANQLGGTGGGIVYIMANAISGAGQINSNGSDALNQIALNTGGANDAPGGGGGGGSVILRSASTTGVTLNSRGGKGGDQAFLSSESEGPGGGGGGGFIAVAAGAPTMNVTGGDNGITLSGSLTEFTPNGATIGAAGQTGTVGNITMTFEPFPALTTTSNSPVCAGAALNFTTTAVAGATYAWSGPNSFTSTTQNPTINPAAVAHTGTFQVIYTSAGGCKDTNTVAVVVNPLPVVNMVTANPLCSGSCTGVVTANTSSGTTPYGYLWSNAATTPSISSLCAGPYSVTVTDANNCVATGNATVTAPAAIVVNSTPVAASCNGNCNGSVTINASGGTGAYQYSLNGGAFQASNSFTGLCAGAYSVTVRDANNCTQAHAFNITQPAALTLVVATNVPSTCTAANGSVTLTAAGGTTAYQYNKNGGPLQASATFGSLAAGAYVFGVTDANGCTATVNVTVTNQAGPTASIINQTNVSCFGGLNGSVLIGATGGTAPITYDLNPGPPPQASNMFSNLTAGAYSVTVADGNGCTSVVNFTITAPTQLTYVANATSTLCNAACNGQITVTPAGGTPPYEYSSNNGITFQPTSPITGLCPGTTFLVVRDANGCLANSAVNVPQPTAVTGTFVLVNPLCPGSCDGSITVNPSGGTGAGTYSFSVDGGPSQPGNVLTGLCAGSHSVVITDANGCTFTSNQVLTNPPGFTVNIVSVTPSNCGFNDGGFEVSATGGVAPYQYSNNGGANQLSGVFPALVGGAYTVVVTDNIGCQETIFVGVNDIQMSAMLVSQTDVTCNGVCDGTVITQNTGGSAPITYELDNSSISQPSGMFNGLCAGPHIISVYDAGLCVANVLFTINEPSLITFSTNITNVACNGASSGDITFTGVAGGTGAYMYSVNGSPFQVSPTFTGLPAGTYNLAVQDANLCQVTGTATITENTAVSFVANSLPLTCFNNGSGLIQLLASGGQPPYTYSDNNGVSFSPTPVFPGLAAGNYNIVVNDALGCAATGVVAVTQPAALAAAFVMTPTSCNGLCDGTIQVNASGGTTPYMYSADNGTTFQMISLLSGLCAGPHQMVVRDANSCLVGSTQNVTEPTVVTFNTVVVPETCGGNNGSITINASGGTPGYTYSNDNGTSFQNPNIFNALNSGTYQLIVHDVNSCPATGTVTVNDDASPVITGVFVTDVTCNGLCDGIISITATGGTAPLSYSIGGAPQASSTFNGVCASTVTVSVADANGCTVTQNATVNQPAALVFVPASTDLLCNNDFTGTISIAANGGTTPYLYSYDNGTTFSSVSSTNGLAAGNYNLVVEDANGCQTPGNITVSEPTAMAIASQNSTAPSCALFCDGQATLNVTGGTIGGSYIFTWSNSVAGPNQNTALNLCAGTYTVDVEDDNGCAVNTSFTLVDPAPFVIASTTATDALCFGDCNGSININAPGGTQYSIDGGTTLFPTATFNNLCPGVYNIQTLNANGCIANTVGIVNEPTPVQVISTPDSVYCGGSTIPLFAFAFGGVGPYTYAWSNAVNTQSQNIVPVGSQSLSVIATDANGCPSNSATTNLTPIPPYVANLISSSLVTCAGNPVTLTANLAGGFPGYQYNWSTGDTTQSITFNNNAPATYTVIVNDQCNYLDTLSIAINTFVTPQVNFTVNNAQGCSPLAVTLTNTTPAAQIGANCVWTFSDGTIVNGCGPASATFATAGCYSVTLQVTSPDGCPGTLTQNNLFCVFPNPVANFDWSPEEPTYMNTEVQFNNQSTLGFTYNWNFAGMGTSTDENPLYNFSGADTGLYQICMQVTTVNGCVADTCKELHFGEEFSIYVPNTFTPDGDGVNDEFFPVILDVAAEEYEFMVFDRWGEMIFLDQTRNRKWDGTYRDMKCKQDVYVWKLKLQTKDGDRKEYFGHVSLLR